MTRHKCLRCGRVRAEKFMRKPDYQEKTACSQFGNREKQWICKGNEAAIWQENRCKK